MFSFQYRFNKTWLPLFFSIAFLNSCQDYHRNKAHQDISSLSIKTGEGLAKKYCQSCHSFPNPSLLDTRSWEMGVLPQMGPRLGIYKHGFKTYPSYKRDAYLDSGFYPPK